MPRPYGVYVHFPWCERKCPYCDFAVSVERPVPGARYARAVLAEMERRAPAFAGLTCRSLYLGGGTPSLWEPEHVASVVSAVRRLGLPAGAEVTLEANPESVDAPRLAAWRGAGVNRVSIGIQSFDAAVLAKLGRRHGPEAAERAVREARRVFENVSVDLIYGGRRSTVDTARADAARAARLGAVHVSAYALTLDPEVLAEEVPFARLARAGKLVFPSEAEVLAQARAVRSALRQAGLARYEISNFARPGFASVHNRIYWSGESYLGLGAGSVGCLHEGEGAVRWTDHRTPEAWLADVEAGRLPTAAEERLGAGEVRAEGVMLALRTARGLDPALLPAGKAPEVDALVAGGLAWRKGRRIVLTARGLDVHSAVAERLMS